MSKMMTGEDLKNSILQMAMQGKLVEQRAEEGTGEELYQEIQTEKSKLIKEGKIKKQKKLPPITEEEIPFEIPESWVWVRWGELSESIQYGYNAPAQPVGRIRMVRISDIQDNKVLWDKVPYCDIPEESISDYLLEKNDILFARTGGTVGKSYIVQEVPEEAIYAGYLIRTRYSSKLAPLYLKFFMESELYWRQLRNGTIATAQPNCNGKTLSKMILPLPPLAEQKRIVAKIEELMPFVEKYSHSAQSLTTLNTSFPSDLKKSILQMAVEGKLVPQNPNDEPASVLLEKIKAEKEKLVKEGKIKKQEKLPEITEDEKPFDIPESWEWCRLGNVIDLLSGQDFKPSEYSDISGKTVYITGASCLTDDGVISQRWTDTPKNLAYRGDLLLVCKGSGYGKTAFCDVDEAHIARQIMAIKKISDIDLRYIRVFIRSQMSYIKDRGQGVIPGIDRNSVLMMILPLPPLNEQKRIVARIEELLPVIDSIKMPS